MDRKLDINKITTDVITDLAKVAAKSLYNKVIAHFSDVQKKEEIDFGYAFENYLNYSKSIHEKTKTLLYRHAAKPIYSFYEPIGLKRGDDTLDTININNILKVGNKIIITGTGGIGKSVMMKHFFLNSLQNTNYIPVIIELRGLNTYSEKDLDIIDYMYNVMETLKFRLEKRYFEYSLETGCYIILLDGFDEVKNDISVKVTKEIKLLSEKYPDNYYIVSSRPLDEFTGWNQFEELNAMVLSKEQALSLIEKLDYDEKIKNDFYNELDEILFEKYYTFASNPLLLTIMLLTYENRMSIPDKLNDFFEQAFTILFHTHDATKEGYKRDILSKLGYEDFKTVFSYFCFKSFFNSDYKFSENKVLEYIRIAKEKKIIKKNFNTMDYLNDLTNSVCMLIHEGLEYRFSHRSFQEYFAALYTTQLDDTQQKKFLKLWLQDSAFRATSNYLDMLYDLQSIRFIKNVLAPSVRELYDFYKQNGESQKWLIKLLFNSICVRKVQNERKRDSMSFSVGINEIYYFEMMERTCTIARSNVEFNKRSERIEEKGFQDLIVKKYGYNNRVTFSQLKDDGYLEMANRVLNWVVEDLNLAVQYIDSVENDSTIRKRKFSSMLEEL